MNHQRYKPQPAVVIDGRTWPNNVIEKAPMWCSVDLRDGNQALVAPMTLEQKIEFFKKLIKLGFKEIEVAFPAASDTEFAFTRALIEDNLIPGDVTIQVLTQARKHIIEKTFESIEGVKSAIVHLYNSTSTLQRDVVFNKSRDEIKQMAVDGALLVKELAEKHRSKGSRIRYEYSPESFTGTELDFAAEVCNAVLDVWEPSEDNIVIINLPSTVELTSPNIYADQIEVMCRNLKYREHVAVSLHTHNDRGCAVAASELGIMAGGDRVEGTLFGNGERTGNADLVTMALNMFSQGVDPKLDISDINGLIAMYETATNMKIGERHPYAGDLVYTAFSGSHQDAIRKGMMRMDESPALWEVPYLPIDPQDVGRSYEPIIRINSQSGKGGVAFILERNYRLNLPKGLQQNFGEVITAASDRSQGELQPEEVFEIFKKQYINIETPLKLVHYREDAKDDMVALTLQIIYKGEEHMLCCEGGGILEALCIGLEKLTGIHMDIMDYNEHAMDYGSRSRAITYMQLNIDNQAYFGAGVSSNISKSSIRAVISALNKKLV